MSHEASVLPRKAAPHVAKFAIGIMACALLGVGALLWVQHGATVFYDMLAAGFTCL